MNTILLENTDFIAPGIARIAERRLEHMRNVLKSTPGSFCKVGLLGDRLGTAKVLRIDGDCAELQVMLDTPPPPPLEIILAAALPRPQTYRKILHSAISMGVKQLVFFGSFKVEKSYWSTPFLAESFFQQEAQVALEQCRDTQMPTVEYHPKFKPFIEDVYPRLAAGRHTYLAHPVGDRDFPAQPETPAMLVVGPEGGFTDYEVERLLEAGAVPGTLGARILRTEVAVPALLGRWLR